MTVPKGWRYDGDDRFPAFEGPGNPERHLPDDYEAVLALLTHSPTAKLSPPFNVQPLFKPQYHPCRCTKYLCNRRKCNH